LEGWRPNDPRTFIYLDRLFTNTRPAGSEYSIVEVGKLEQDHHGALNSARFGGVLHERLPGLRHYGEY